MAKRRYTAEEIVTVLRQVEVALANGKLAPLDRTARTASVLLWGHADSASGAYCSGEGSTQTSKAW